MATSLQVDRFASDLASLSELARAELSAFWAGLDQSRPDVRTLVVAFMRELVETYGETAAGLAADWFDDVRDASQSAGGGYRAVASPVNTGAVPGSTGWGLSQSDQLAALLGVIDRLVKQPGRDTVVSNVERDGARFARVPRGKTCAFCLLLGSRGAVYHSRRSAGEGHQWHAHCDCVVVPSWSDSDLPDGYDPDALFRVYEKGRAEAGSGGMKEILSGIRTVTQYAH